MTRSVIVAGARTPIGRLLGGLADLRGTDLGGLAITGALARSGVPAAQVDAVVMGNVVQAGSGPNPARLAAVAAGIPFRVPATTINKLCLSGLASIAYADQLIRLGQYDVVVAGGFESMTNAPHLLMQSRRGTKYGPARLTDALDQDGLICAFDGVAMGVATERYQSGFGLTRGMLDEFAAASHGRATAAMKGGLLAEEIIAVRSPTGDVLIEHDEGVRPGLSTEQLSRLRPAFSEDGLITAGSSSPLSDGAAAVVVMNRDRAEQLGLTWLAEIGAYGTVAGPDPSLILQPANAIRDALRRDGQTAVRQLDLIEINEAFAGVVLASTAELKADPDRINVNGGAIAMGHPVGMSGTRLVLTLAHELRRRGGGTGAAALCGGGGQGDALLLHVQ